MQRIVAIILGAVILFTSCVKSSVQDSDGHYGIDDFFEYSEGHFFISDAISVYPHDSNVYVVSENCVSKRKFSEQNESISISDQKADSLYVDNKGIYLLSNNCLVFLSHDNELKNTYPVPYSTETDISPVFAVSGTRILMAYQHRTGETDPTFGFELTESVCMEIDTVTGESRKIEMPDSTSLSGIKRIFPATEGFLISAWYNYTGLQETGAVVKYDENAEIIAVCQADEYDASANMLYSLYGWGADLYVNRWVPDSEENSVCLSVDMEKHLTGVADAAGIDRDFDYIADALFCTGQDYLIWDNETKVLSVYGKPIQTEENTLTVLYSADQVNEEARYFAAKADFCIDIVSYDAARFGDVLRMKLLAGDKDFDVVYLGDTGRSLTPSILNYSLFLPLENYETLTSNMEQYMDGVTDLMTWNGHLYGVPHRVSSFAVEVSEKYTGKDLPAITDEWTQEDFWNICEKAADTLRGNQVIARSDVIWQMLLTPVIEDGITAGSIDSGAVLTLLENLKSYTEAGILSGMGAGYEVLLNPVNIPADPRFVPGVSEDSKIVSQPLYNGQKYGSADGYVFVNHLTEKSDLAVRYLEMITSPDNLRLVTNDRSLMLKDSGEYRTRSWGGRHTEGERNAYNYKEYTLSEENKRINDAADSIMTGIRPSLYAMNEEFTDAVRDVIDRMLVGEISHETAAEEIVQEAEYRFLE